MKISSDFYHHIRETISVSDIVRNKISITKKGSEYIAICPFHNEKTPSFTINNAKKFYHCFGCSAHGDVIRFVSETNGMSYKQAAIKIASDHGIELPKMSSEQERHYEETEYIYHILKLASQFFMNHLTKESEKYLINRGLTTKTIKDFSIGYAPGNASLEKFFSTHSIPLKDLLKAGLVGRKDDGKIYEIFNKRIMFPIKNIYNKIIGFGGRTMGNNMPKYINSPETVIFKKGSMMYGENIATGYSYKANYSILVEGYMDVITLHQNGFKQAVASLGTAITINHIEKLWRLGNEIIVCLDGDNAGSKASSRLIDMSLPHIGSDKCLSFIDLPTGSDPEDLINLEGKNSFENLINLRITLSEKIWKNEYSNKTFNSAESKAMLEHKLQGYSNNINDIYLKNNFKRYFKNMIWNSFFQKKNNEKIGANTLNSNLISTKQYSEIEILEHSICTFLVEYPDIINHPDLANIIHNLEFNDENLNAFKANILDIIEQEQKPSKKLIGNNIKNTRFCDTYSLLSSKNDLFLDYAFLNKDDIRPLETFKLLYKKYYLLLLKQEYMDLTNTAIDIAESKSSFYFKEIHNISKEIKKLSDDLINN